MAPLAPLPGRYPAREAAREAACTPPYGTPERPRSRKRFPESTSLRNLDDTGPAHVAGAKVIPGRQGSTREGPGTPLRHGRVRGFPENTP